jgi:hypothetical protein
MLVVEGEQRRLVAWDFFHCPSEAEHVIVGSGNAPSVVLAVGGRGRGVGGGVVYRVCAAAARFGASVERETTDPREAYANAYAGLPRSSELRTPTAGCPSTEQDALVDAGRRSPLDICRRTFEAARLDGRPQSVTA